MSSPFGYFRKTITRWRRQQQTALRQMTYGKTRGNRFAALGKSRRVDAMFLLAALAPITPLMISDELGWSRSALWYAWAGLSTAWAIGVSGVLVTAYLQTLRLLTRRWLANRDKH